LKFLNQFKMPAIVGQKHETMTQCSGANQKVEVADHLTLASQPAALATEDPGGFVIEVEYLDTTKKRFKSFLATLWVAGIKHALVQFSERDVRQRDALRAEVLNTSNYGGVAVQVMNYPIGVDKISQRSGTG